jgi:hypothetical protein
MHSLMRRYMIRDKAGACLVEQKTSRHADKAAVGGVLIVEFGSIMGCRADGATRASCPELRPFNGETNPAIDTMNQCRHRLYDQLWIKICIEGARERKFVTLAAVGRSDAESKRLASLSSASGPSFVSSDRAPGGTPSHCL